MFSLNINEGKLVVKLLNNNLLLLLFVGPWSAESWTLGDVMESWCTTRFSDLGRNEYGASISTLLFKYQKWLVKGGNMLVIAHNTSMGK